uniref:Putative secreted protein n=1 Tax=Anopheles triannulatus TaxID=58253 RepID=A0A2M4B452_9DIPT
MQLFRVFRVGFHFTPLLFVHLAYKDARGQKQQNTAQDIEQYEECGNGLRYGCYQPSRRYEDERIFVIHIPVVRVNAISVQVGSFFHSLPGVYRRGHFDPVLY